MFQIGRQNISKNILETLDIQFSKEVPAWTQNEGEWDYLRLSFILKAVAYAALLVMAICFYRKEKKHNY
jgi:hypothetical protein